MHEESQTKAGFILTSAEKIDNTKLTPSNLESNPAILLTPAVRKIEIKNSTTDEIADFLALIFQSPVVNNTKLDDAFDASIDLNIPHDGFSKEEAADIISNSIVRGFKNVGLIITPSKKVTLKVMVVDSANSNPIEN